MYYIIDTRRNMRVSVALNIAFSSVRVRAVCSSSSAGRSSSVHRKGTRREFGDLMASRLHKWHCLSFESSYGNGYAAAGTNKVCFRVSMRTKDALPRRSTDAVRVRVVNLSTALPPAPPPPHALNYCITASAIYFFQ